MVRVSFVDGWSVESSGEPPVEVTLPHDAMIHEPRSATTAHGSHSAPGTAEHSPSSARRRTADW